jgi:hypothetical protein
MVVKTINRGELTDELFAALKTGDIVHVGTDYEFLTLPNGWIVTSKRKIGGQDIPSAMCFAPKPEEGRSIRLGL